MPPCGHVIANRSRQSPSARRCATGHAATPPTSVMNSRGLFVTAEAQISRILAVQIRLVKGHHTTVAMSALGQKQTCAVHQSMSALPPIATAKADSRERSCPLYPRKETSPSVIGISAKYTSRQRAKFVRRQTKWQHATLQPSFDTTHRRTHSDLGPALAEVRSARQAP